MDNYGTHKHPKVQAWLKRHPRFVPHFVPTSSSWLNLVERWFGELTTKRGPPRLIPQRRGFGDGHRRISGGLESTSQTFRLDRNRRIHSRRNSRAAARLWKQIKPGCTQPRSQKADENIVQLFLGHYTSVSLARVLVPFIVSLSSGSNLKPR